MGQFSNPVAPHPRTNEVEVPPRAYIINFRAIHLEMKEIHFKQYPVLSYVLESGNLWFLIFLLRSQKHQANINFFLGLERVFRKCILLPFSYLSLLSFSNDNLLRND